MSLDVNRGFGGDEPRAPRGGLDEIWRLLLAAWNRRAEILTRRLDAVEKAAESATSSETMAKVLPSALRRAPPKELAKAIRPVVEDAIVDSVHRHAGVMADAISPLLLPAIKRAI